MPEPVFSWFEEDSGFTSLLGNKVHKLNVTSLQWLNESVYSIEGQGTVWNHEVMVIIPKELKHTEHAALYMASADVRCNTDRGPLDNPWDLDFEIGDMIASDTKVITAVAY